MERTIDWLAIERKVLDFVAALCLLFDVDWDEDFEDDAFVLEAREKEAMRKARRAERKAHRKEN